MRPSGDLGHIDQNGRLFYDGRCDRQKKRLGHRINLDHIQQVHVHVHVHCWDSALCMCILDRMENLRCMLIKLHVHTIAEIDSTVNLYVIFFILDD
jgi:hypothetical protein